MAQSATASQCRIVLQARTDSTRLPSKVLRPIRNMPMAVLAAHRLARTGFDTVLATSAEPTDDKLAAVATTNCISVVRGPRDDVLGRIALACADLPNDAIVVRATADNLFPDADFSSLLISALVRSGCDIVGTRWPADGLPYGLSLECFRIGALRRASEGTDSVYDREHVTPWMWRKLRTCVFDEFRDEINLARLRCTVDTEADLATIERVFAEVGDPVDANWRELVRILARQPDAPPVLLARKQIGDEAQSEFVLGTVQLGMHYGGARKMSLPSEDEAVAIIRRAISCGMTHIDTARAYGDSERRIGRALAQGWGSRTQIITKLAPLQRLADDSTEKTVQDAVRASVERSLKELSLSQLPTLLLHRAVHRTAWRGAAWRALLSLRADGLIRRLGVSVADPQEALEAAADENVGLIQLPFNVLDDRFEAAGIPASVASRHDLVVHARSVFLQGVLSDPSLGSWPRLPEFDAAPLSTWLREQTAALGRISIADLCLAYVRACPWVHGCVVGIESAAQLDETLSLFLRPALSWPETKHLSARRPFVPEPLLNPAKWLS